MARWLLTHPHYLNCVGKDATQWEYKEQDRKTKKVKRHVFQVPAYLDPNDDSQWNWMDGRDSGGIIVAYDDSEAQPNDILFDGLPTPDMRPLDDSAKKITAEMDVQWNTKSEDLEGSYADTLADKFVQAIAEVRSKDTGAGSVKLEGMTELLAAMTQMMQQNQQLLQALVVQAANPLVEGGVSRRV